MIGFPTDSYSGLSPIGSIYQPKEKHYGRSTYLEEVLGGAVFDDTVFDLCLLGQVIRGLNGRLHPLHGEEGSQVGRVGGNDDEGEEPPHAAHDATGHRAVEESQN